MSRKQKPKTYDVQRVRRRYPRAYEPWTPEEDAQLRGQQHLPNRELAKLFQRKPGAIQSRRKKLGLVPFVPSAPPPSLPPREPAQMQPDRPAAANSAGGRRIVTYALAIAALLLAFQLGRLVGPSMESEPIESPDRRSAAEAGTGDGRTSGASELLPGPLAGERRLTLATWNIRGYPERERSDTTWFHQQLSKMDVDLLCVQEIANPARVEALRSSDEHLTQMAFTDSPIGTDNAILCTDRLALEDLPDPDGFQHSPEVAWVSYRGFDAVVVSLHLSWKDTSRRTREMLRLGELVAELRAVDPDVILAGDFNLKEEAVLGLAARIGMQVATPADQEGLGTVHTGSRYDHFLLSPDLANEEFIAVRIETFSGEEMPIAQRVSDHLPVVAWFLVDERFRDRPRASGD